MDRTRLVGIVLVFISAAGFGSGALFAKQGIYPNGVDWMTLLSWRFVVAAALSWGWLLLWPGQRRALRALSRRRVLVLLALGILYMGNTGTYYAGLETVDASLAALIVYIYPALVGVISIRYARRLKGAEPGSRSRSRRRAWRSPLAGLQANDLPRCRAWGGGSFPGHLPVWNSLRPGFREGAPGG